MPANSPAAGVRNAEEFWLIRRSLGGAGCFAAASTVGEFVAVDVAEEEPDVDRLEGSMLCLSGEAGVGTRGGGKAHSVRHSEYGSENETRSVPFGVSLVGVALTDEASLELEKAPLLLLRISQCARPTLPSPDGRANGGRADMGRPSPKPSYLPSFLMVGLSASSPSASISPVGGPIGTRSLRTVFISFIRPNPGKAAGRLFRGLPFAPFPLGSSSKSLKPILWATALCQGRCTPPTR